jgi:hypothetical protein
MRMVPLASDSIETARDLGICLGDERQATLRVFARHEE